MPQSDERIRELEAENLRLLEEVDKFRTATEDALQQLDWCIGYFVGSNKSGLARSLGANRSYIRQHLLKRPKLSTPDGDRGKGDKESA